MNDIESAALALVGCRFRLHGREPARGLDCVGVITLATGIEAAGGYGFRTNDCERVRDTLAKAGWRGADTPAPGDVLLMRPGPGQLHLGIRTTKGMVHADAALRRVVERPGPPPWEVLGIWRRLS